MNVSFGYSEQQEIVMSAYEKQQREDYDRYVTLCDKHSFRPMPFVLFQLGYQKQGA